jgi:heme/copper-type cytochrome/quinol oxidase subunit 3
MTQVRITQIFLISNVALFCLLLFFRAVIYSRMYIAPDEPYGFSDIIEFLGGWLLIFLLSVSTVISLFLIVRGLRESRKAAAWLLLSNILIAALANPLHTWVAKLRL